MSTKKVEKYKEEKRNRAAIAKKQKKMHMIQIGVAGLICAAFVGWIGWSVYEKKTISAEPALNSDNIQVVGENGQQYEVKMNDDGTATLVLSESGATSAAEAVLTESGAAESVAEEPAS